MIPNSASFQIFESLNPKKVDFESQRLDYLGRIRRLLKGFQGRERQIKGDSVR